MRLSWKIHLDHKKIIASHLYLHNEIEKCHSIISVFVLSVPSSSYIHFHCQFPFYKIFYYCCADTAVCHIQLFTKALVLLADYLNIKSQIFNQRNSIDWHTFQTSKSPSDKIYAHHRNTSLRTFFLHSRHQHTNHFISLWWINEVKMNFHHLIMSRWKSND